MTAKSLKLFLSRIGDTEFLSLHTGIRHAKEVAAEVAAQTGNKVHFVRKAPKDIDQSGFRWVHVGLSFRTVKEEKAS